MPALWNKLSGKLPRHVKHGGSGDDIELLDYQYRPLDHPSSEIRLIKLKSKARRDKLLNFQLRDVPLRSAPKYTAFSYVWGDKTPTHSIVVNGKRLRIASNLHGALQSWMKVETLHKEATYLWTDAICINQSDDEEKGRQVQIMRQIFKCSTLIFAWLGEAYEDSDLAMHKVAQLGEDALEYGIKWTTQLRSDSESFGRFLSLGRFVRDTDHHRTITAINNLRQREYFSRLWMFQELAFSHGAIICCGESITSWVLFFAASDALDTLYDLSFGLEAMHGQSWQLTTKEEHRAKAIIHQVSSVNTGRSLLSSLWEYCEGDMHRLEEMRPLLALLAVTSTRLVPGLSLSPLKATQEQDRVFSLFGLANDIDRLGIKVDYSKSAVEVYTLVANQILIENAGLYILELTQREEDRRHHAQLPSWAVDWSAPVLPLLCIDASELGRYFNAGGAKEAQLRASLLESGEHCITFSGLEISRVRKMGMILSDSGPATLPSEPGHVAAWLIEYFAELEHFAEENHEFAMNSLSRRGKDEVYRIPIADQEKVGLTQSNSSKIIDVASDHSRLAYSILIGEWAPPSADPSYLWDPDTISKRHLRDLVEYINRVLYRATFRRVCSTFEGHLGLMPPSTQPGDLVCVFFGGDLPLIIREIRPGFFRLIGAAYVLGIMDGEAMDENREVREFALL